MQIVLAQVVGVPGDIGANAVLLERTLQQHRGADVVVFPELFLSGYFAGRESTHAVSAKHEVFERITRAAKDAGSHVVFGFAEQRDVGISNSVAHITDQGTLAAVYRKAQLFGEGEDAAFVAGDTLVLTNIRGTRVGLLNCFDVEFPEHARELSLAGADVLITVAANMEPYGADHSFAVRSRAIENRKFHVYVNRVLVENELNFVGESCVVAPSGEVLAKLGSDPAIVAIEVDLESWTDQDVDYLRYVRRIPVMREQPSNAG